MKDDTISRAAAVSEVEKYFDSVLKLNPDLLRDAIISLPPAQQWIPCNSGRFPEESGTYTVTAHDGATNRITYAKYQKRLKRWELTGARAYWRVLAWMPHIEPWEGGRDA